MALLGERKTGDYSEISVMVCIEHLYPWLI